MGFLENLDKELDVKCDGLDLLEKFRVIRAYEEELDEFFRNKEAEFREKSVINYDGELLETKDLETIVVESDVMSVIYGGVGVGEIRVDVKDFVKDGKLLGARFIEFERVGSRIFY